MINLVDALMIAIVGIACLRGACRGCAREMASVILWAIAFYVALQVAVFATAKPDVFGLRAVFLVMFLLMLFLSAWIMGAVGRLADELPLVMRARVCGGVLGILRGVILTLAVIVVLQGTSVADTPEWKASCAMPYVNKAIAEVATPLLPVRR